MSLEVSLKKRVAAKGWLTRSTKAINDILTSADVPVSKVALELAVSLFDVRMASLDGIQGEIELLTDDDKLEADIEAAATFRSLCDAVRVKAAEWLAEHPTVPSHVSNPDHSNSSVHSCDPGSASHAGRLHTVKLPRLELPKYSGKVTEWQTFWERFKAVVDESELPAITKFSYLQSLVVGEAKSAIEGIALTAANYRSACNILQERFGRRETVIQAHIQALLSVSISNFVGSPTSCLRKLEEELLIHIRGLESLDVKGDTYGIILTPVILSRLPSDIRLEWARSCTGKESNLAGLLSFLKREVELRERSEAVKEVMSLDCENLQSSKSSAKQSSIAKENRTNNYNRRTSTAASLQASSDTFDAPSNACIFCDRSNHASKNCWSSSQMTLDERHAKVKASRVCFVCLRLGHIARTCKCSCSVCNGKHHKLLCRKAPAVSSGKPRSADHSSSEPTVVEPSIKSAPVVREDKLTAHVSLTSTTCSDDQSVLMKIAKVSVQGRNGVVDAYLFFDEGSDRSYISQSFANRIRPKRLSSINLSKSVFGGRKVKGQAHNIFEVQTKCSLADSDVGFVTFAVTEVPKITSTLSLMNLDKSVVDKLSGLVLANSYDRNEQVPIDLLIGLDNKWALQKEGTIRLSDLAVAEETVFGWILSGKVPCKATSSSHDTFSHTFMCIQDPPISEAGVRTFWELETIGINPKEKPVADPVLEAFEKTVEFRDGRYTVSLPWKAGPEKPALLCNKSLALSRLHSLSRKLAKDPDLKLNYDLALSNMEEMGVIEEVKPDSCDSNYPMFYLPNRPVIKADSSTTQVRPVFDASASGPNGVSLNDCLEAGPCLLTGLVEILLRFRRWLIAITADISKAFLQICLFEKDKDVHRFFWLQNGQIRTMRFNRVTFGIKSSPFLLNAVTRHHLAQFDQSSRIVQELTENLYVDDFLSGADTEEQATCMFEQAYDIMSKANLKLSKWNSSSNNVRKQFVVKDLSASTESKVLGINWNSTEDKFFFSFAPLLIDTVTKRVVLSCLARLFDPLGLVTPFIMRGKILFQQVWREGFDWDSEVCDPLKGQFLAWLSGLNIIGSWQVNRCYFSMSWGCLTNIELHVFCDSSEVGYGAVAYLRATGLNIETSLVMSKARVAPLKKICLPRLELLACLVGARLLRFVGESLRLPECYNYRLWSDSQVALCWIKSNAHKWKPFIANRVSEIQSLSSPDAWYHCPGRENPADLVTRGISAVDLVESEMWLVGPDWLSKPDDCFPSQAKKGSFTVGTVSSVELASFSTSCAVPESVAVHSVFDWKRHSSFTRLVRIAGWVNRFLRNCRTEPDSRVSGDLSSEELSNGRLVIFREIQNDSYSVEIAALRRSRPVAKSSSIASLTPFLDNDGLLRLKGRLQLSELSYEEKHPIILPSCYATLLLVRCEHVSLKHAGVDSLLSSLRDRFWIVGARRLAKTVKRQCVHCSRQDNQACNKPAAPLHGNRVSQMPPFVRTGIDFAGPLYCHDFTGHKFYICLFVCAVIRAIHIELVDSLSTAQFILAFRRFISRRGLPAEVYTDNAKTFKAAESLLQKHLGSNTVKWRNTVPRAPWWGGWWERLVGPIKSSLKKTVGSASLSKAELETILIEIEATINSRPLTFVGDTVDCPIALSPNHFLIGRRTTLQPPVLSLDVSHQSLNEQVQWHEQLLHDFWNVWSKAYLRNLPTAVSKFKFLGDIGLGSIVLIEEDHVPRLRWVLGRVIRLHPSSDGVVRSVTLKTSKGEFVRAVQRLHILEVDHNVTNDLDEPVDLRKLDNDSSAVAPDPVAQSPVKTRSGRVVKPRVKLDL